jgi:hypothetical protein
MPTFPQIFLIDDSNKSIKIGGYQETMKLLSDIFSKIDLKSYSSSDKLNLINFFTNSK